MGFLFFDTPIVPNPYVKSGQSNLTFFAFEKVLGYWIESPPTSYTNGASRKWLCGLWLEKQQI